MRPAKLHQHLETFLQVLQITSPSLRIIGQKCSQMLTGRGISALRRVYANSLFLGKGSLWAEFVLKNSRRVEEPQGWSSLVPRLQMIWGPKSRRNCGWHPGAERMKH